MGTYQPVENDDHFYLKTKNVLSYGLKKDRHGNLLVPLHDAQNILRGVQMICPEGKTFADGKNKRYVKGSKKKGSYFTIAGQGQTAYFCEGYATGASAHAAVGATVIVCFDSGNLETVVAGFRAANPESAFVILADDDKWAKDKDGNPDNPGIKAALSTAKKHNCPVAIPQFRDETDRPTDFNDLACAEGLEEVRKQILSPSVSSAVLNTMKEESTENGKSVSNLLLEIGMHGDLFHCDGEAYGTFAVNGHHETWPLKSDGFSRYLRNAFFKSTGRACSDNAYKEAVNTLEAMALSGPEKPVFIRVGKHGDALCIDLCNDKWEMVEITAQGWKTVKNPDVKFIRSKSMMPLPEPAANGNGWNELRRFYNVKDDADFILLAAWTVGAFSFDAEYPILIFQGEAGAAKSTSTEITRLIVDPNKSALRSPAQSVKDLMISTRHTHVMSYDNLSGMNPWFADAACKIATGGAFATRALFSNNDENVIVAKKPQIFNGIDDLTGRQDFSDRAIVINLERIPEEKCRPKDDFLKEFETAHPGIFGAVCDTLSKALLHLPHIRMESYPRMASFAKWTVAAEQGKGFPWEPGRFMDAYTLNRDEVISGSLGGSLIENAIISFTEQWGDGEYWKGTATELLNSLSTQEGEKISGQKAWPKTAHQFSGALNRSMRVFRANGISFEKGSERKDGKVKRFIKILKLKKEASTASTHTENSNQYSDNNKENNVDAD
ncbi:MAG: toprim domain-containing protein, partial [Desulfobacterales bacterium]